MFDFIEQVKGYFQLGCISLLAASVQMYISKRKFTFFHYIMSVAMAILAAYIADAVCNGFELDEDLTTGIIAVAAYTAPHLFETIENIAQQVGSNPLKVIAEILKIKRG